MNVDGSSGFVEVLWTVLEGFKVFRRVSECFGGFWSVLEGFGVFECGLQ